MKLIETHFRRNKVTVALLAILRPVHAYTRWELALEIFQNPGYPNSEHPSERDRAAATLGVLRGSEVYLAERGWVIANGYGLRLSREGYRCANELFFPCTGYPRARLNVPKMPFEWRIEDGETTPEPEEGMGHA